MSARTRSEVGRYVLHDEIASGGMATVHLGRLKGQVGFTRTVAIKRLHPQFAKDPEFVSMFLDEARLAARIRHPNVVPTLDVVATTGELFLVMDYIHGISLHRLMKQSRELERRVPVDVACAIAVDALRGLHAAHEAKSERGQSLDIVHRDVSPQNVMVGIDGLARVLDFGVAKASWRVQTTRQGQVKGKVSYMAPEQVMGGTVGPWTDVHALGIVLWEVLTGERLFPLSEERGLLARFAKEVEVAPPSALNPDVPPELDAVVLQAVSHAAADRPQSALSMADLIEAVSPVASSGRVGRFVQQIDEHELFERATRIAEIEGGSVVSVVTGVTGVVPPARLLQPYGAGARADAITNAEPGAARAQPESNETVTQAMPGESTPAGSPPPERSSQVTPTESAPPRPIEDVSKISMARTLQEGLRARPRVQRKRLIAGAIACLLFGVVAAFMLKPSEGRPLEAAQPGSVPSALEHAADDSIEMARAEAEEAASAAELGPGLGAGAATDGVGEGAVAAPSPASAEVVELAELPVEVAEPPVEATKASPKPAPRRATVRRKPVARATSNCNPPYTVDARGIRHLKLECVQ